MLGLFRSGVSSANKNLPNYVAVNARGYKACVVDNAGLRRTDPSAAVGRPAMVAVDRRRCRRRRDGGPLDVTIDVTSVVRFVDLQLVTDSLTSALLSSAAATRWHSTARMTCSCPRPYTDVFVSPASTAVNTT